MGYTFSPGRGRKRGMPWKESSVMDERMRFVIRLKDGESMASLCREFGISRKTGYKIFERYEQCGLEGLRDGFRTRCLQLVTKSDRLLCFESMRPGMNLR